jgi:hypothetical protein
MRYVAKRSPPDEYQKWCTPTDDWRPSWGAMDGHTKRLLQRSLVEEQGYLCAYCMRRISHEPEVHAQGTHRPQCHVDHVIARSHQQHPTSELSEEVRRRLEISGASLDDLDIAYGNLVACCPNTDEKRRLECGDLKGDRDLPLTPLDADCEAAFGYTANGLVGAIEGESADAALAVIRMLQLNDRPTLREQRRQALEGIVTIIQEWEVLPSQLHREVQEREIAYYRSRDEHGRYQEFCAAILDLLEPAGPDRKLLLPTSPGQSRDS